ncbi:MULTISPECIES: sugar ABC transporter ATP-binding protein [unclassified Bradyrhizobium]|uniref:sugar ABC transporter ATP-binding protein n=1 Tax=unclassified Bradyrhizobium TaxID=2631580 RepID=UPI00247AAB0B|nr:MULTISPECIES: sugar ABC transporter ATP-binding protein [unclassified Bradyrhizobium]
MTPAEASHLSPDDHAARLELRGLSKAFNGIPAVINLSLDVWPGEIHAIVGENGAGKTTVMNMLSGVFAPDAGEIRIDGAPIHLASPRQAQDLGIATVFQELSVVPAVSIAENIYANHPPTLPGGIIRWSRLYERAHQLLSELGVDVDVNRSVASLDTPTRQLVEIAKALSLRARLLLLDEPTSSLTAREVHTLFDLLRRLRDRGIAIIYISHQMSEILAIADRITVMRDGHKIGTWLADAVTADEIVRHMVGHEIAGDAAVSGAATTGAELLRAERLSAPGHFHDVGLALRQGEIVGLAGLMGAGRSELGKALVGARLIDAGRILIDGHPVSLDSVGAAIRHGIAYLPGDRKSEGLFLDKSLADNIVAASLSGVSRFGLLDRRRRDALARTTVHRLRIRTASLDQAMRHLSGGNQQKTLLGKWLVTEPRILIVDEPTKGVDVAAKAEIHAELRRLASEGAAILVISSDLPELLGLSDRVLVMRNGAIAGELPRLEASQERVMALASGIAPAPQASERVS